MRWITASRTHVGLKRKLNEDRVLERPECGLWVVADGMGGHDAGEVASSAIVGALADIPVSPDPDAVVASALEALQEVNASLRQLARSDVRPKTIGSTVVGLALAADEYRCFWAGDSRAYLARGDELLQITRDHSLVQDLLEAGLIDGAEAETHPDANVITRAVGAAKELEIDCVRGKALPGDIFLLASDGLTRVVSADELLHQLRTANPAQAAAALIEVVLSRGAPDNVTLVICRVA